MAKGTTAGKNRHFGNMHDGEAAKDEWLTPPALLAPLGEFDLDPCAPVFRPWRTASNYFTKFDDGLKKKWFGRVWLNPPYGDETGKWLAKMAIHKNGLALTFARTETEMFHRFVWQQATAIFFFRGRLVFYNATGAPADNSAGAPSVVIAYDNENAEILRNAGFNGKFIKL